MDNVNAMLSFVYAILANDCAAALESVGLDPYAGFLHRDRSGRASLALDLMEELRPIFADRFVVTCVNNRLVKAHHFETNENGAVMMNDAGRRVFLGAYQARKKEQIQHPFLNERISWGLIPYVQALLLSRFLRDDLDSYPPFLWK
jgi:CRISPR-associated protein Cas1